MASKPRKGAKPLSKKTTAATAGKSRKPAAEKPANKSAKKNEKKPAAKGARKGAKAQRKTAERYRRKKEVERQRQAAIATSGQDIGPIPECANPKRRAKAEKSCEAWARTYLSDRFGLPGCEDHSEQFREIDRIISAGGLQAIAAPRGDGKTTRCDVGVLMAVLSGRHSYAVLITATQKHAPRRIGSLKMALMTSQPLLEDYPEVCVPIRAMNNRSNRCPGMTSGGANLWPASNESQWAKTRIVLPTVPGSKCSGAIVESAGLLEAMRGLQLARPDGTISRPTLALLDDPQTDRSARSPVMCEQREEAISKGLLQLGPPDRELSALAAVTVIQPGDVADCLLDRSKHPAWHGIRKQMLYAFPTNMELWDEYATVYLGELADGSETFPRSREFYLSQQAAMDAGAVVAWESRHPGAETALEFAMRMLYRDRGSFMSEMQNTPEREGSAESGDVPSLTVDEICTRMGSCPRGVAPIGAARLTWFCDVHKDVLYWVVCAWSPAFTGTVIDYGTWPKQDAAYFDHRHLRHKITTDSRITAKTREGQTLQALDALFGELKAREWKRADGIEMQLDLGLVDANDGAVTDQVYESCRAARRKHGLRITPSHGMPFGPAKCPISRYDYHANKDAVLGDEWMLPAPRKCRIIRHVVFDAGRRKTFLWKRLTTPAGDPGSLTLFAGDAARHRLLGEHVCSEVGAKTSGPYGELIVWTLSPNRPNHWLDCLSGCCTAESILGGRLTTVVPGKAAAGDGTAAKKQPAAPQGTSYFQL